MPGDCSREGVSQVSPRIGIHPKIDQRLADLSHDELRKELERQAKLMPPEDQARLLQLIEAMQDGKAIDADQMGALSPSELRESADGLRKAKD